MPTTQPSNRDQQDDAGLSRDELNVLIGRNVVHSLGSPKDLLKVQVNPVGNDRYRVNILVGKAVGSARVGDSFFLTADGKGNIMTSSPKIVRLY